MKKKKDLHEKQSSGLENPGAEEKTDAQRSLSREAWVAIGTIVAALITGAVTVLMHVLPSLALTNATRRFVNADNISFFALSGNDG